MTKVSVVDNTKHAGAIVTAKPFTGAVPGITSEYISISHDNLIISALGPGVFLHGGSGDDVLSVVGGRNILDGGAGSNFLIGGTGVDTFYIDARSAAFTWSTIVNFHKNDDVTIWGWKTGVSTEKWIENAGAAGYLGATLQIALNGGGLVTDQLTFAGSTVAQASHFVQETGTAGGTPYLHISA